MTIVYKTYSGHEAVMRGQITSVTTYDENDHDALVMGIHFRASDYNISLGMESARFAALSGGGGESPFTFSALSYLLQNACLWNNLGNDCLNVPEFPPLPDLDISHIDDSNTKVTVSLRHGLFFELSLDPTGSLVSAWREKQTCRFPYADCPPALILSFRAIAYGLLWDEGKTIENGTITDLAISDELRRAIPRYRAKERFLSGQKNEIFWSALKLHCSDIRP